MGLSNGIKLFFGDTRFSLEQYIDTLPSKLKLEGDVEGLDLSVRAVDGAVESSIDLLLQGGNNTTESGENGKLDLSNKGVGDLLEVDDVTLDDARGRQEVKDSLVKLGLSSVDVGQDLLQRSNELSERTGNFEGVLGVQLGGAVEVLGNRLNLLTQIDSSVLELDQRNDILEETVLEGGHQRVQVVDIGGQVTNIIQQRSNISEDGCEGSEKSKKPQH